MVLLAEFKNYNLKGKCLVLLEIQGEIILNHKKATIIKDDDNDVIGCVYSIDKENLPELDRQEGVHQNIYEPKEITVIGSDGKEYNCRTYWKRDVADQPDGKREFELPSKVLNYSFSNRNI